MPVLRRHIKTCGGKSTDPDEWEAGPEEGGSGQAQPHSSLYEAFAEAVFAKDADTVTEEELARIKYLRVSTGSEGAAVEYSFDSPYESDAFEPETLKLKGLVCRGMTPEEAAGKIPVPERLLEFSLDRPESLDGIDAFSGLEILSVEGISASDLKQLVSLGKLRSLSLEESSPEQALTDYSALSVLTGLEELTFYSNWTYAVPLRNVKFLDGMTNLRQVDFSGGSDGDGWGAYQFYTDILGDISNVFNHPGLEELILNNCSFEIDFGRLTENPSLRRLEMKEVSLEENFHVESYNGMTDIWYDGVSLDEHRDFLICYPGLRELYLDGNQPACGGLISPGTG